MSLQYVILGWLNYEPMTGYDLNSVIEVSTHHFWSTSQSQIYRTLSKIEEEGWVTQEVIFQETRPPRKVYHITESGQAALKEWLTTFHKPKTPRIPWLIQIFFASQISDEEIIAVLEKKLTNLRARLSRIQAARSISAQNYDGTEEVRDIFYWNLTIDFGETLIQSRIQWIEKTLVRIRSREYQKINLDAIREKLEEKETLNAKEETNYK